MQDDISKNKILLFTPSKLLKLSSFLQILIVKRSSKNVEFDQQNLSIQSVNKYFSTLPAHFKELLVSFGYDAIDSQIAQLNYKWGNGKLGIKEDLFLERGLLNYFHTKIKMLIRNLDEVRFYHKIKKQGTKNYSISKCNFDLTEPILSFEVLKIKGIFSIKTFVQIKDEKTELSSWNKYHFLIEKEGAYFLLKIADVAIMDWLSSKDTRRFFENENKFLKFIIPKLSREYKVNHNNVFSRKEIKSAPINAVYISEISGTMLMFTPRFIYEGISIEGDWKEEHQLIHNGELFLIYRKKEKELEFLNYLQSLHPDFAKQSPKFFYLPFTTAHKKQWFLKTFYEFINNGVELIGLDFLQHFRYSTLIPETVISQPVLEGNDLVYKFEVFYGKEKIKIRDLQKTLRSGQNSFLLKDNSIAVLTDEWLESFGVFLKHGRLVDDELRVPHWILLSLEKPELKAVLPEEWKAKWMAWQKEEVAVVALPKMMQAKLRPYQQKGFEWMVLLSEIGAGACLADDMGLGKTLQTICFMAYQKELNPDAKFLIVSPASVIFNWENEIQKFAPLLKVAVLNGAKRDINAFFKEDKDVLICGFQTFRSDIHSLILHYWNTVVIDESQNIKNPYAQITKAAYEIKSVNKIALSGTPVMNNTFDLYAQIQFLLPGLFPSADFFEKEYAQPIDHNKDKQKLKDLNAITSPFILRRIKSQVADDLPEKSESILWCEMGDEQRVIYDDEIAGIRNSVFLGIENKGVSKSMFSILQSILKLRQICCSPILMKDAETNCKDSAKIDLLIEELLNLDNQKVLVFSQFKGMLHLVAERLEMEGVPYLHFDGSTPVPERQRLVNQFQEGDKKKVFLISLKAGNSGINLTAAEYVFLLDPWWNEAVQQQAIDRTHRIGQTKKVIAYKMICRNSIEERILELQAKKKMLSDELVSEEDGFAKNLSEEDIQFLFS